MMGTFTMSDREKIAKGRVKFDQFILGLQVMGAANGFLDPAIDLGEMDSVSPDAMLELFLAAFPDERPFRTEFAKEDRKSTRLELQSPDHLVCRLLLEKKKIHIL